LTDKRRTDTVGSITLSKDYWHCDRLSISHDRLLNLPGMRHKTQRWRSVGLALVGQTGRKTPCNFIQ